MARSSGELPEPQSAATVPQALRAAADLHGQREALVDGPLRMTFVELRQGALDFAAAVVAHGIQPGERVAVWAPNSARWIVAALGLLHAGAVLVPVNTRFKGPEASYVLERSGARLLVVDQGFLGIDYLGLLGGASSSRDGAVLPALPQLRAVVQAGSATAPGCLPWDDFLATAARADVTEVARRCESLGGDDVCDIMFTSGTTGRPKGAMTTHRQNVVVNSGWASAVGLTAGDRYLAVNPFFNSFGFKAGVLACVITGATILPQPVFDVDRTMQLVEDERVTVLPGPPTLYATILDHPSRAAYDLSSARLAVTGAAVVPVALVERMREELTFRTIVTAYGLTETCGTATVNPVDADPVTIATTVGIALPGTQVAIMDPSGRLVGDDEPGEVVVRGYNVMLGYLDDPVATAEAIDPEGWLHTGDVGMLDGNGYLRITDRLKDMFVVGGFNVYPAEVEQLLMRHPAVSEVAVIGVPDERLGERGCAYVVPRHGASPDPRELVEHCRANLANYKVPAQVVVVGALPRNASGKVLKRELRDTGRPHGSPA